MDYSGELGESRLAPTELRREERICPGLQSRFLLSSGQERSDEQEVACRELGRAEARGHSGQPEEAGGLESVSMS
jgi:hypothetical protein